MKIDELARPGLLLLGLAATAALGFAAGMVASRDPEALRRLTRRAARALERATLATAQAREHVADLWAEAREEALAEVDAEDFERAARRPAPESGAAAAGAAAAGAASATRRPTKPAKRAPRPRRKAAARAEVKAAEPATDQH